MCLKHIYLTPRCQISLVRLYKNRNDLEMPNLTPSSSQNIPIKIHTPNVCYFKKGVFWERCQIYIFQEKLKLIKRKKEKSDTYLTPIFYFYFFKFIFCFVFIRIEKMDIFDNQCLTPYLTPIFLNQVSVIMNRIPFPQVQKRHNYCSR